jgi:hypothetical protein
MLQGFPDADLFSLAWSNSANIALVLSVPPEHAGVAGGVFNTALQVGATVLLALATTVQLAYPSAENKAVPSGHGYQASFLFTMATVLAEAVLVIVFFKDPLAPVIGEDGEVIVQEKRAVAVH